MQIVGLQFLFVQKFADLWDTKCSVSGLATLYVWKNIVNTVGWQRGEMKNREKVHLARKP